MSDTETQTDTKTEETPAVEASTPDPKDVKPANSSPESGTPNSQDTAGISATPAKTGSPASATPKKPAVDVDALIEAAAKAQSDAAERIREADTLKNRLKKWEEVEDSYSKAETPDAKLAAVKTIVRNMLADGYDPSAIIQVFAEDVELPPEQIDPTELPKVIPQLINKEVQKLEKAREAREAAAKKEAEDRKAAEDKAEAERKAKEDEQTREEYVAECAKDLRTHSDKFPLCNAWIHRITPEKVLSVAAGFAKINHRAPTGEELFPAIESEFRAELEKATGKAASQPSSTVTTSGKPIDDEIERELDELDRKRLLKKDPTIQTGPKVEHGSSGRTVEDDILDQLERMDKSRDGRLQYD